MKRHIAIREVRPLVQQHEPFVTHTGSLWSRLYRGHYVVFSYGEHWPLFMFDAETQTWFENKDKASRTTSHHRSASHPHCETKLFSVGQMLDLVAFGYKEFVKQRLVGGNDYEQH